MEHFLEGSAPLRPWYGKLTQKRSFVLVTVLTSCLGLNVPMSFKQSDYLKEMLY